MRLILAPTLTQGAEPQFPPLCTHPRSEGASSISRGDGLRGQRSPDWPSASPFHSGPPCWGQARGQGQGPRLESLFPTPPPGASQQPQTAGGREPNPRSLPLCQACSPLGSWGAQWREVQLGRTGKQGAETSQSRRGKHLLVIREPHEHVTWGPGVITFYLTVNPAV